MNKIGVLIVFRDGTDVFSEMKKVKDMGCECCQVNIWNTAHYTDEIISVPFLSELCGVSEQYLRRLFQAEFGYSPAIYIRLLRLEYAKSLLETNEYSVTDIAMLSGFNSPAYFSREFKKEYGVSPKAFNGI